MNSFTNPLDNIKIASPCSQDWAAMVGDNRKRFCGECNLNVYNLSGMSKTEAENLLMNAEGRLCVRFYKRADGTVLTQDCPVGWAAFKRRVSTTAATFASLIFGVVGGLGFTSLFSKTNDKPEIGKISIKNDNRHTMGAVAYKPTPKQTPKTTPTPREFVIGEIEAPTPKPTPKKKDLKQTIQKVLNVPQNQS